MTMKRILILTLLLALALVPGLAAEEAQETPAAESAEAESEPLALFDVRYYFEHRLLRQLFYAAPESTMESLRDGGLYERWNTYTAEIGFETTYAYEQFSARDMLQDSGIRVLMLTMPAPDTTLLCYRIYLCWDPETETAAYYTAEYDKYDGFFDEGCLICGWSPDGSHHYYLEGKILPDSEDPEYEKALAELNEIIEKLDKKECFLQEMMDLTKRGSSLISYCESILDSYEGIIRECAEKDEVHE